MWRAVDEMLDRLVAVKEMRIDGLDPEDTRTRRERTLREARATARIDHPHVVRVYDVVDEGEHLWIVMELVAGRSLERIMAEDGPLGPAETARIGLGLVAALGQVHARGVLHRDIKPGNVLVESEAVRGRGRVVLTDFGIAAIQDAKALTMVGMLVGSPDYMAPERIAGRPQGPPSDVWSLGATLCAALAGRSPFSRDTTLATLHAVLYEEPELPAGAGPLRPVLTALLQKEPSSRPNLDALETFLERVAFPPPTPTIPVPPESVPDRSPGGGDGVGGPSAPETAVGPGPAGAEPSAGERPGPGRDPMGAAHTAPGAPPSEAPEAPVPAADATSPAETKPGTPAQSSMPDDPAAGPAPGGPPPGVTAAETAPGRAAAGRSPDGPGAGREPRAPGPAPSAPAPGSTRDMSAGKAVPGVPGPIPGGPVTGSVAAAPDAAVGAPPTDPARRAPVSEATPAASAPDTPRAPDPRVPGDVHDAVPPRRASAAEQGHPGPASAPHPPEAAGTAVAPAPPTPVPEPSAPSASPHPTARSSALHSPSPTPFPDAPSGGPAAPGPSPAPLPDGSTPSPPHEPLPGGSTPTPFPDAPSGGTATAGPSPAPLPDGSTPPPPHEPLPGGPTPTPFPDAPSRGTATAGTQEPAPPPPGAFPARPEALTERRPGSGPIVSSRPRPRLRRIAVGVALTAVVAGAVVAGVLLNGGGSSGGGRAGPSVSASTSSSPTVEGTSRPQSLPPGAHREAGGFAWATPEGWKRDVKTGAEVHYTAPDGTQELAAKSSLARGDLMDSWEKSEQDARQGADYRKIRLARTTFRDHPAVVWEYSFTLQGEPWRARLLGFTVDGKSYQINTWYRPEAEEGALRTYGRVRDSFTVL
ncbi:protein kinase [Streptomyces sp. NPDC046859]|uniref:serine/threonine-protein kinase n=1 Tax=Streptomyces sp. NPDC046859 TaxID=3155734 RepID=UPI0033EC9292